MKIFVSMKYLCVFSVCFPPSNPYLLVRSGSGLYFNVDLQFSSFFIFCWYNINMLPSLIYKHLKTILIKHITYSILNLQIAIFSKSLTTIFKKKHTSTLKIFQEFHFPNYDALTLITLYLIEFVKHNLW